LADMMSGLFTPECYQKVFVELKLFHFSCLTLIASKLIGLVIVTLSAIVKVPQIIKIMRAQSVEGLSLEMYCMEIFGYAVNTAYNFRLGHPFSTYGENVFLFMQNCILIKQLLFYSKRLNTQSAIASAAFFVFCSMILSDSILSIGQMSILQTFSVCIFAIARFPQIRNNYMAKSTGQLAFVTCLLNFLGGIARVFTILREVKDAIVLFACLSALTVNTIIIVQFALYDPKRKQAAAVPSAVAMTSTDSSKAGRQPQQRPKRVD